MADDPPPQSKDPADLLQVAIVARLQSNDRLKALLGDRVYDEVPTPSTFPYIVLGDGQIVGDDDECGDHSEIFMQIHGWSEGPGWQEVSNVAAAAREAMKPDLVIEGFQVVAQEFIHTLRLRDPDVKRRHTVTEYRFLIAHPSF